MSEKMSDCIISPSDGDTSEEEEFSRILYTNNPKVVEDVDKISNSSNTDYTVTQLVSVSFTTTQGTYMYFFHCIIFTKYILLIYHKPTFKHIN